MTIYIIIAVCLTLFYVFLMGRYYEGFKAMPIWNVPKNHQFSTKISILIPARNEEKYIIPCIESILKNNYPAGLLEIIVINDHSTDKTAELVENLNHPNVKIIHLADHIKHRKVQSFKKKGIEIAIAESKGDLIITTDGDCVVNEKWLSLLVSYYEVHQPKFIAAPVNFYQEYSRFEKFQSLDFAGMIALTGAGIYRRFMNMCNGANLAYEKKVFYEVNGFVGIDKKASGDDMMLLQKVVKKYPDRIGFVKNKNACTYTTAKSDLKSFYHQRVRWASKSTSYDEFQVTVFLGLVWLFCLSIPISAGLAFIFGIKMLYLAIAQFIIKCIIDYVYLGMVSRFFDRSDLMKTFLNSAFYHLIYIIVIGALGNLVKRYEWKGRRVE